MAPPFCVPLRDGCHMAPTFQPRRTISRKGSMALTFQNVLEFALTRTKKSFILQFKALNNRIKSTQNIRHAMIKYICFELLFGVRFTSKQGRGRTKTLVDKASFEESFCWLHVTVITTCFLLSSYRVSLTHLLLQFGD